MSGINDLLRVRGDVKIELFDENGEFKSVTHIPNLVVTVGRQHIASRMSDTAKQNQMTHMQIGSNTNGTTTPATAPEQTTLLGNSLSTRVLLSSAPGGDVVGNTVQYTATFGTGNGTGAVSEAGIFNASSGGVMLCRTVFPIQNKQATDSLTITWTVSFLSS
jgi:hypothetical protein